MCRPGDKTTTETESDDTEIKMTATMVRVAYRAMRAFDVATSSTAKEHPMQMRVVEKAKVKRELSTS